MERFVGSVSFGVGVVLAARSLADGHWLQAGVWMAVMMSGLALRIEADPRLRRRRR